MWLQTLTFLSFLVWIFELSFALDFPEWRSFDNLVDNLELNPDVKQDAELDTVGLITKYGYPVEKHCVVTDDGYILGIHRIPKEGATPVLLVHGVLDSSATWVIMGPNKGLAYLLFDAGYDVWMMNARGNTYSKNHTTLNSGESAFWKFSFHEIGIYDIPATIDYVLETTRHIQLHYIGHSQGTTCFWVMCSQRPEYNMKVILMQALAPTAFIGNTKSPVISFLAFFRDEISLVLKVVGVDEFLPNETFITHFGELICQDASYVQELCSQIIFLFAGYDKTQMNNTMLPVIFGHTPAGASTRQLLHFAQLKSSSRFRQYDYGIIGNWRAYKRFTPPNYRLDNVNTKVALYYGANDWLATPLDVGKLFRLLPNIIKKHVVPFQYFNHLDFVWGVDVRELLYNELIETMKVSENLLI